jgi:sodium-coupled monocarboxylate transporter 8/12
LIEKSDQLMPYFVMDELKMYPGVPGLFVACVFSASLSTLSSGFNALATVTWDDFLKNTKLADMSEWKIKLSCKLIGAIYGVFSVLMAFVVGLIGSVLEAAISLAGSLVGPLFGLYMLALMCPFANSIGVITGLLTGQAVTLWILVGSIMYPKAAESYPTFTDRCVINLNMTTLPVPSPLTDTSSEGDLPLYHIAFLLVPVTGFVVSASVGALVSLLTCGHRRIKHINPRHLSPIAWFLWPKSCVPTERRTSTITVDFGEGIISTVSNGHYHHTQNGTSATNGQTIISSSV